MRNRYKVFFALLFIALIVSNLFWAYTFLDAKIASNYSNVSCQEWQKDLTELKKLLPINSDKSKLKHHLEQSNIDFNEFEKGANVVIQFNSFDLMYDENGKLIEFHEN